MPLSLILFLAALAGAVFMAGVIWTVQGVHYALFPQVGAAGWNQYHAAHTRRMTGVVLPPMVLELGASGLLAFLAPSPFSAPVPHALLWLGFGLALLTWIVTAFVSVPLHARLGQGWDADTAARLLRTNWLRTALWSAHALLLLCQAGWLLA